MQGNWSTYYHGQTPPQASTSGSGSHHQQQQQQQQQPQQQMYSQRQTLTPSGSSEHIKPSTTVLAPAYNYVPQQFPTQIYFPEVAQQNPTMLHPIRTSTSSSISSSTSMSGSSSVPLSPLSMRASMSSSNTGRTSGTPATLPSPMYLKDGTLGADSWFGSLQDSYPSADTVSPVSTDEARPAMYRMQRMSISSPMQSSPQQASWSPSGNPPQEQTTPRRASVATFPAFGQSQQLPTVPELHQSTYSSQQQTYDTYSKNPLLSASQSWQSSAHLSPPNSANSMQSFSTSHTATSPAFVYDYTYPGEPYVHGQESTDGMDLYRSQSGYTPQQQTWQSPSAATTVAYDKYNFSGVLLQSEDLHLLGPDPLSAVPAYSAPISSYQTSQSGWQPTFSFGGVTAPESVPNSANFSSGQYTGDSTPKALHQSMMQGPTYMAETISPTGQNPNWNFASFHGFTPLQTLPTSNALLERAASAPPVEPVGLASARPRPSHDLTRRRGSSVDSPAIQLASNASSASFPLQSTPPQLVHRASHLTSPVYLGHGPVRLAKPSLATRRATVGPNPLDLSKPPMLTMRARSGPIEDYARAPKSAPASTSPRTASSAAASPTKRPRGRRSNAPMFINFTGKDAKKLLSGVAPSGSSKRKREEEELKQSVKQARSSQSSEATAAEEDESMIASGVVGQ